jgi:hypothetical protein
VETTQPGSATVASLDAARLARSDTVRVLLTQPSGFVKYQLFDRLNLAEITLAQVLIRRPPRLSELGDGRARMYSQASVMPARYARAAADACPASADGVG